MSVKVKTNSNVIFLHTICNLVKNEEEEYHGFGKEILQKFSYIKKLESFKDFKNAYQEERIYNIPYQYTYLAVHINEDMSPKPQSPDDGWGPNRSSMYISEIYPLIKKIYEESNFQGIYKEQIEEKYKNICNEIQPILDSYNIEETLFDFWKDNTPKLIFVPDVLRVDGGGAAERKNTFYSITGAAHNEKGEIVYYKDHMVSNCLHEYSHYFFRKYLYADDVLYEENETICKQLFPEARKSLRKDMYSSYDSPSIYFEETFMRAVQILLSSKVLEEDVNRSFTYINEIGFIYVRRFFDEIKQSNARPIDSYFNILREIYSERK